MKLYIVRHAIAVERESPAHAQDSKRSLAPEGVEQARQIAKGLKRIKPEMEALFSSPYVRAMETAEQIERVYGGGMKILQMPELKPDVPPAETSKTLKGLAGHEQMIFVGHEPHLTAWINHLTGGARCRLKKGGVACVEIEDPRQAVFKGTLRWLMTPKQLALIGR